MVWNDAANLPLPRRRHLSTRSERTPLTPPAPSSQANLIAIIRRALALGINHFETARFYGTSELQYADALATLIESGEVSAVGLSDSTTRFFSPAARAPRDRGVASPDRALPTVATDIPGRASRTRRFVRRSRAGKRDPPLLLSARTERHTVIIVCAVVTVTRARGVDRCPPLPPPRASHARNERPRAGGEVRREDIIVQTKCVPAKTAKEFRKTFEASWRHMKRLG